MFLIFQNKDISYTFGCSATCLFSHELDSSVNYLTVRFCFEQEIIEGSFIIARDNSWEAHLYSFRTFFPIENNLVLLFSCIFTVFVLILCKY